MRIDDLIEALIAKREASEDENPKVRIVGPRIEIEGLPEEWNTYFVGDDGAKTFEWCEHEWVDATNEVVESGEICVRCYAIRAADNAKEN